DLAGLPRPSDLTITRRWKSAAALSVPATIEIVLENARRSTVLAALTDNVPQELSTAAPELELKCRSRGEAAGSYQIAPTRRGDSLLGSVYIRYQTPMRLAERWAVARVEQTVCVHPNLEQARQQSVYLVRSRQIEMESAYSLMGDRCRSECCRIAEAGICDS